jgi:hypothetical protein
LFPLEETALKTAIEQSMFVKSTSAGYWSVDHDDAALPQLWAIGHSGICFIVRNWRGQALTYVYCEDEPGRHAAAEQLTRDEALRIVANVVKLLELRTAKSDQPFSSIRLQVF